MSSSNSIRFSGRMVEVCSTLCLVFTVIVWVMAFRLFREAGDSWPLVAWALIAVRVAAIPLLNDELGPRLSLYADRVAWNAIVIVPLVTGNWGGLGLAGVLWAAWAVTAGVGRHYYGLVASDAERARAAELEAL